MSDLENTTPPPAPTDVLLSRVLFWLGIVAVIVVLAIGVLSFYDKSVPDALPVALGSAVTGLASLLVGRRT